MSKRFLLIGGNFSPELTGIGKYNGEMIDMLAHQGYQCTVITSFPYYPQWKIQAPYTKSAGWFKKEIKIVSGNSKPIEVFRCPHYVPKNPTGTKRMISDFSFTLSAFFKVFHLLFTKKFDFVLVVVPSFQLGLLGLFYKKIKGAKFFYHIQDLQIDAARDFNLIKSKVMINVLLNIEKYILKRADVVSSISKGMIKKITLKHPRDVVFFPNWVDTVLFYPLDEKQRLKALFNFKVSDKVVLYSGAIGEKQGLEAILESASLMKDFPTIKFVICGSGPYKEKLQELKESRQLDNVIFLPLQPFNQLNSFLNMADIHLVLQKANAADLVMPSKLTAILSVGGVAIITANESSSLYDVINDNKMGVLIEPENSKILSEAILKILNTTDNTIHNNARNYAEEYLSIDKIFKKYTLHLQ